MTISFLIEFFVSLDRMVFVQFILKLCLSCEWSVMNTILDAWLQHCEYNQKIFKLSEPYGNVIRLSHTTVNVSTLQRMYLHHCECVYTTVNVSSPLNVSTLQ